MNGKIEQLEDFFDLDDFEHYKKYVIKNNNSIKNDSTITEYVWNKYRHKFLSVNSNITGLTDHVTISNSNKPVRLHQDRKLLGTKWKILIYLNEIVDGGTIFILDHKDYLVENKPNKMVMFDMDLFHKSQKFQSDKNLKKLSIGFRALG